jgi:uncharacterized protein (TIGR02145 family)
MKKVLQFSTITCIVIVLSGCGGSDENPSNGAGGFQSGDTWKGLVYETVTSPYTGKVWLDRNLGASQACTALDDTACYGDYYQWGRNSDGHEDSGSTLTATQATDINNSGSSNFITTNGPADWVTVDSNGSLRTAQWSSTDGTSVCPVGFRVPTAAELEAETINNGVSNVQNSADAFNNFLKLPSAGFRLNSDGTITSQDTRGMFWTSSVDSSFIANAVQFSFEAGDADTGQGYRAVGESVRCIKD